jgi:hypothetical protein
LKVGLTYVFQNQHKVKAKTVTTIKQATAPIKHHNNNNDSGGEGQILQSPIFMAQSPNA